MLIHLDFETRSELKLKGVEGVSVYRYAEHPSTDIYLARWSYQIGNKHSKVEEWLNGDKPPAKLIERVLDGWRIVAHNAQFEMEIWRQILAPRYGWHWVGYEAFIDSMAMAMITNLPGKLEQAAGFFGTHPKDMEGHKLMMKMCAPARVTKNLTDPWRNATPANIARLSEYCAHDIKATRAFVNKLPRLSKNEKNIYRATRDMNNRGIYLDVPLATRCLELAQEVQDYGSARLVKLTKGQVQTAGQREKLGDFIEREGGLVPHSKTGKYSFSKDNLPKIDMTFASEAAIEALDLYNELNSSSVSKFAKMLRCVNNDNRLRGMIAFAGAPQTARDAGRLVQVQNLPRGILKPEQYDECRDMIMSGCSPEALQEAFGDPLKVMASMCRPCLRAAPGKRLVQADLSAIEGRALAWQCGEEQILDAYREGKRLYAVAAAGIFKTTYEAVVAAKKAGDGYMDLAGKVSELALGYQGGVSALNSMGANYGVRFESDEAKRIVDGWREARWRTKNHWYGMEAAAVEAILFPGSVKTCDKAAFKYDGRDLRMRLASGRCLWYRRARLVDSETPWGEVKPKVEFYGVHDGRAGYGSTYGGKLTENETQANSRDILMGAVLEMEYELEIPLVMRVHDEVVAEVDEDSPVTVDTLCEILSRPVEWAPGLPLAAAGWEGQYYKKD